MRLEKEALLWQWFRSFPSFVVWYFFSVLVFLHLHTLLIWSLHLQFSDLDNLQGIYTAPLWDMCKGQFVGVLSTLDFILILKEVCVLYFILVFNRGISRSLSLCIGMLFESAKLFSWWLVWISSNLGKANIRRSYNLQNLAKK